MEREEQIIINTPINRLFIFQSLFLICKLFWKTNTIIFHNLIKKYKKLKFGIVRSQRNSNNQGDNLVGGPEVDFGASPIMIKL
jgi:hypothetical protein